jgi:hypothetical protein
VTLEDIFDLDKLVEEFDKKAGPGVYLFENSRNFMRALLSVYGRAQAPRGPARGKLCRFALQSAGSDRARRRNYLIIPVACSHFIGREEFNKLAKEVYPVAFDLIAEMDSITGGEFSRWLQESKNAALARAEAAEAKLKVVEARAEEKLKELEAENAELRRDLEDARAGKGR